MSCKEYCVVNDLSLDLFFWNWMQMQCVFICIMKSRVVVNLRCRCAPIDAVRLLNRIELRNHSRKHRMKSIRMQNTNSDEFHEPWLDVYGSSHCIVDRHEKHLPPGRCEGGVINRSDLIKVKGKVMHTVSSLSVKMRTRKTFGYLSKKFQVKHKSSTHWQTKEHHTNLLLN